METFWFFWLQFRHAYDSNFWFSLGHKRSYNCTYNSDSDSVASENQPLLKFPSHSLPRGVLQISSDGDKRRILAGVEGGWNFLFLFQIFWGLEILTNIFLVA